MITLQQSARFSLWAPWDWRLWLLVAAMLAVLLLVIIILEGWPALDTTAAPMLSAAPATATVSDYVIEWLRVLALLGAMLLAWYLPLFEIISWVRALQASLVCAGIIAIIALAPGLHRSVRALRWGTRIHTVAEVATTSCMLLFILALPAPWLAQRRLILVNLVFCGGLTLYREIRRRWRSGDRSRVSSVGGILVVLQFLALISAVAVLAALIVVVLNLSGILRQRDPVHAGFATVVWVLSAISLGYLGFYFIRRIMRARGFSWFDPPNWRTFWHDFKYKIALHSSARWPFFRITMAGDLANIVRTAYVRSIIGDASNIDRAALIRPPLERADLFTFTIIGDPGEGDDSQLYPLRPEHWEKKEVIRQALQGSVEPTATPDALLEMLLTVLDAPDFAIISSDVVYPAGEMMDYERAVYRPYKHLTIPIYAIPGNHDWYDNLNGFFLNFTYAAAHEEAAPFQRELYRTPWNAWSRSWRLWQQIAALRKAYDLKTLGGLRQQPETQQRLSFFEMAFDEAPLTVLGLDNGVIGSIDAMQYAWAERRLHAARQSGHLIFVLLGMPLYVDGAFAGEKLPPENPVAAGGSYGLREIYELLRRYNVDIVMAGDTHAYQRYTVEYAAADGERHLMHHFVNGGGGAYLSWPADFAWPIVWDGDAKLNRRAVYQASGQAASGQQRAAYDDVRLHDLFPSADQMFAKFTDPNTYKVEHPGWLGQQRAAFQKWYTLFALDHGLTNALDHDQLPLLQSYVTAQMRRDPGGKSWTLELMPWFSVRDDAQPEPQYGNKITLTVRG